MLCTNIVLNVKFCTQHVRNMFFSGNSMKNLSSYCGLTDARMRASEKDLPVPRCTVCLKKDRNSFFIFLYGTHCIIIDCRRHIMIETRQANFLLPFTAIFHFRSKITTEKWNQIGNFTAVDRWQVLGRQTQINSKHCMVKDLGDSK